MYKSLKPWLNVPAEFKEFIKRTGTGDKVYGKTVKFMCYPSGKVQVVTSITGAAVTSIAQLYVEGDLDIKITDTVIFEGRERDILSISTFYDTHGKPDCKVVYL